HAPSVNQQTLVSVNQHRHHQPRRDILILFVARLSSRLSRHSETVLSENAQLRAQVAWFQRQLFGRKSERRIVEPNAAQGTLG
ncbi:hypothetical protein GWC77_28965, partial [Paraburkholderia sp. NMBU_R16]|uniref:transposase n=1 Tax=Paraburkholderia sp. NMBU_R16 TaxID=2698676 RepID=UPI001C28136A